MDVPEVHPVHSEAHAAGRHWSEYVMSGAALLVSAVSLWVAVHHGRTMERLVQANTLPNVELEWSVREGSTPGSISMSVSLANSGVGPARIETLELWDADAAVRDFEGVIGALKSRAGVDTLQARVAGQSLLGSLLGAGRDVTLAGIEIVDGRSFTPAILDVTSRFQHRICYCSVFDECFIVDSRARRVRPEPVAQCPTPPTPYDDQLDRLLRERLQLGASGGAVGGAGPIGNSVPAAAASPNALGAPR